MKRRGEDRADVVVIGAGAAGLAAAGKLHGNGVDVVVLEARERIGGRILTVRDAATPDPIELGAEFVHGRAPEVTALSREAGLRVVDITGHRWQVRGKRLHRADDFWKRIERVMGKLDVHRTPDRSFADFLSTTPGGRALAHERATARTYVEGFHAADPALISERALAEGGTPGDDVGERRIGRIFEGYDRVPEWLAAPLGDRVRLSSIVSRIEWERGAVEVGIQNPGGSSRETVAARAVIVTVPLGVLKAPEESMGSIQFEPALAVKRETLAVLAMGTVARVAIRLAERFWATDAYARRMGAGGRDLGAMSFFETNDPSFPTWWTHYPSTTPVLVAWRGGPQAQLLLERGRTEVEGEALASLARQFRLTRATVRRLVEGVWFHDWTHDPFARGAYSYQVAGGSDAPVALARPTGGTLFFAGEAAEREGATGTVHGAIASGVRAATQVMRALSGKREAGSGKREESKSGKA